MNDTTTTCISGPESWKEKTPDEVLADINTMLENIFEKPVPGELDYQETVQAIRAITTTILAHPRWFHLACFAKRRRTRKKWQNALMKECMKC